MLAAMHRSSAAAEPDPAQRRIDNEASLRREEDKAVDKAKAG
jgi:hypothetical protein